MRVFEHVLCRHLNNQAVHDGKDEHNIRVEAEYKWQFHCRVLAIVTSNTLTLFTLSSSIKLTVIASNWCCVLLKSISISLHLAKACL